VLFWAFFYSWICLTNALDGLKALNWLPPDWHYISGNFALVVEAVSLHHFPWILAPILFSGDILWQGITAILFWCALKDSGRSMAITAFSFGIALWAAFIMADEIFIAYVKFSEGTYFHLFTANLLSLIAIVFLPRM